MSSNPYDSVFNSENPYDHVFKKQTPKPKTEPKKVTPSNSEVFVSSLAVLPVPDPLKVLKASNLTRIARGLSTMRCGLRLQNRRVRVVNAPGTQLKVNSLMSSLPGKLLGRLGASTSMGLPPSSSMGMKIP